MIVRAEDLPEALPLPAVPEVGPRDALGEHYAGELLSAFRAIHETSGHVVAHLEANGDALVFLTQVQEFDRQVKAIGGALMGLGCVASCDGCA